MEKDKLQISQSDIGDVRRLTIMGYLDAQTAPMLEGHIKDNVDAGKNKLLINFKDLVYISSAGLGVFMSFIEQIRKNNGDIKLAEMNDSVFNIFDLLGFPMLFDIDRNENILIEKFNSNLIPHNEF